MSLFYAIHGNYDLKELKSVMHAGFSHFGGIRSVLGSRTKILLKPNFVRADTIESAAVTHPNFILAVAELCLDHGCKVSIGDSPGFGSLTACINQLGLTEELKHRGIDLVAFRKVRKIEGVESTSGRRDTTFSNLVIAAELDEFDGILNLPKLKTHCQMGFTGATKNLFGCVPGKRKAWRHMISGNDEQLFARMIVKTAEAVAPIFHIADGISALHVHGPTKGEPYPLNAILMGTDSLELDWLFCDLIGFKHMDAPLFVVAGEHRPQEVFGDKPVLHPDFIHAKRIPIRFNPFRVFRSVLKHQLLLLKEKF